MSREMPLDQWVRQWRTTEVELQKQKMRELQAMTDEEAVRIANAIMWWTPELDHWLPIWMTSTDSGLIEQQRYLLKLRHAESSH
jgi:hypothetical protein